MERDVFEVRLLVGCFAQFTIFVANLVVVCLRIFARQMPRQDLLFRFPTTMKERSLRVTLSTSIIA